MPSQNRKRVYSTIWHRICQCLPRQKRLLAPTFLEKIGQCYYLVDCWHGRVLYTNNLKQPLKDWKTLSGCLGQPHSLASDGQWLVIDESSNNRLSIWKINREGQPITCPKSQPHQILTLSGIQPHRVRYDKKKKLFYCLTAKDQKFFILKANKAGLKVINCLELKFLKPYYCRSFTLGKTNEIYFAAGSDDLSVLQKPIYKPEKSSIYQAKFSSLSTKKAHFEVVASYKIPVKLANMNDIFIWQNKFYLTAVPNQLISCEDLARLKSDFCTKKVLNLSKKLELSGRPYFLNYLAKEKLFIVPEIDQNNQINCYRVKQDQFYLWQKIC